MFLDYGLLIEYLIGFHIFMLLCSNQGDYQFLMVYFVDSELPLPLDFMVR